MCGSHDCSPDMRGGLRISVAAGGRRRERGLLEPGEIEEEVQRRWGERERSESGEGVRVGSCVSGRVTWWGVQL